MSNRKENIKLLIVGGSGFFSGTLAQQSSHRGCHIWTITQGQRPLPPSATNLIVDRQDEKSFKQVVDHEDTYWDMVVDCIAFTPKDIKQDLKVFKGLTDHLVFISTDFVYDPKHRQFPQSEETEYYDLEGYGYKKRLSELTLIQDTGEIPWTIIRPTHIYGPGSELGCLPAHSRDPELITRIQAGETLKLVSGGNFLQQPILALNLADFVLDLQGNPNVYGQILNAAGPDVLESRRYYEIIGQILGVKICIEEIPMAPYLAENPLATSFLCHRIYNMGKAKELGIPLPGTAIEVGLREQVEYLLENDLNRQA
jgi:nucleoside-diphosphate-sugar epimerase